MSNVKKVALVRSLSFLGLWHGIRAGIRSRSVSSLRSNSLNSHKRLHNAAPRGKQETHVALHAVRRACCLPASEGRGYWVVLLVQSLNAIVVGCCHKVARSWSDIVLR